MRTYTKAQPGEGTWRVSVVDGRLELHDPDGAFVERAALSRVGARFLSVLAFDRGATNLDFRFDLGPIDHD